MYLFNKKMSFEGSIILVLILSCIGCKQELITEQQQKDGLCLIEVEHALGDSYDPFKKEIVEYLPCPLTKVIIPHINTQDSIWFYLLSNYVAKDQKLLALPIGVLKLESKNSSYQIIILQAEDVAFQAMQVDGFDAWITKNYAVTLMIQDWFLNLGMPNEIEFLSWENEFYARRVMKQIGL